MSTPPPTRYLGSTQAGRYTLEELIGRGSFASVFRATTPEGDVVAVKVLESVDPTAALRFAREIRVLRAMPPSPNVATYLDHGETDDGWPLIVMEFVDGITLKVEMTRSPLVEATRAVTFMAELCAAFADLHQLGVAHRDVKPENILLARDGGIKLIDFGLIRDAQGILKLLEAEDPLERRIFDQDLDHRLLVGTPEYMAPEQFSDAAATDAATVRTDTWSDVFSLGVILYQLLSGRHPFPMREAAPSGYAAELLRYLRWRTSLTDADLPPCPGIDEALSSILRKALRQDPRHRQVDARPLESDLRRYLRSGEGVRRWEEAGTDLVEIDEISTKDTRPAPPSIHDVETGIIRLDVGEEGRPLEDELTSPFVLAETVTEHSPEGAAEAPRRWIEAPTLADPPPLQEDEPGVSYEEEIPTDVFADRKAEGDDVDRPDPEGGPGRR